MGANWTGFPLVPPSCLDSPPAWGGNKRTWTSSLLARLGVFCPTVCSQNRQRRRGLEEKLPRQWQRVAPELGAGWCWSSGSREQKLLKGSSWRAALLPKWHRGWWMASGPGTNKDTTKTVKRAGQILDWDEYTCYMEDSQALNMLRRLYRGSCTGRNCRFQPALQNCGNKTKTERMWVWEWFSIKIPYVLKQLLDETALRYIFR